MPMSRLLPMDLGQSRRSRAYWMELARRDRAAGDISALKADLKWARLAHGEVMAAVRQRRVAKSRPILPRCSGNAT